MTAAQKCPKCGAQLASDGMEGICPKCLMNLMFPTAPKDLDVAAKLPEQQPGDCIGRYKLLQKLGEGGYGIVYMAQQEEPVRRCVALKIIKLGMDTKQVIARFQGERQALAVMHHPHIAKVFDAGATDTGRPYFVMELVRGVKITEFCNQKNLSTAARLDLFVQICRAIQHAHQTGIIHRDIKPSNILVSLEDGVAVPKVIDFGIAKATTDQRLSHKTAFTAFNQFIGTPAYMSPEQADPAEAGGQDIDTRSDIYSLGVLLYELLTGKTPFEARDLLAAGLHEMRRTIREKEPARPSTRLSTMLASELTVTAKQRQTIAPKLIHQVRGDLDWVVMKALEKDRARRYETANGLATDVRHYLSHEPVLACPPSAFYRFQKLVRRNRFAFAAGTAIAASLVIGLGVSTWLFARESTARRRAVAAEQAQAGLLQEAESARVSEAVQRQQAEQARGDEARLRFQAESAEKKAKVEAAKSQQVAQLLQNILQSVAPSAAHGCDTTMLRELLDKTAENVGKDLTNQPEIAVELRHTLGEVYHELRLYQPLEETARETLRLSRSRLGEQDPAVPRALSQLADSLMHLGRLDEAEPLSRQALAMQRTLLSDENPQ